jgi:hypothetical protein
LQARTDGEMDAELQGLAKGFTHKVNSYTVYDVNGYRFHTRDHERSRHNRKTTNTGVRTPGTDGLDYYGLVDAIYELYFDCRTGPNPVVFKCHWFDHNVTRTTPELGLVEIRQDSVYQGEDVYIVAQEAMQVYYLPWTCQKDTNLRGWYVAQLVSRHSKLPVPINADYNVDPNTREFYQPEGLEGRFDIDMFLLMGMEVDNDIDQDDGDEDEGEEVQNAKDLELLERLHFFDDTDESEEEEPDILVDNIDSDHENYDPSAANREDYF